MEQEERKARRNSSNSRQSWNISSLYERILAVAQKHPTNVENKENQELAYPSSHWAILFQQRWAVIFVLCLSFSFYESKITSFTFFRLGL